MSNSANFNFCSVTATRLMLQHSATAKFHAAGREACPLALPCRSGVRQDELVARYRIIHLTSETVVEWRISGQISVHAAFKSFSTLQIPVLSQQWQIPRKKREMEVADVEPVRRWQLHPTVVIDTSKCPFTSSSPVLILDQLLFYPATPSTFISTFHASSNLFRL